MNSARSPSRARLCAALSACSVVVFALVCVAAQFLRGDLDWIAAPLSYYLVGPFGDVVTAYLALSVGLVALGFGFRFALIAAARSVVPLALFIVAGAALTLTALSEPAKAYGDAMEWELVHRLAAMTTFLCITVAMLLQSFWMRLDPSWRERFVFAFTLAAAAFIFLWIYALVHTLPHGLAQKAVIALIVAWLGWAALALWCRASG